MRILLAGALALGLTTPALAEKPCAGTVDFKCEVFWTTCDVYVDVDRAHDLGLGRWCAGVLEDTTG